MPSSLPFDTLDYARKLETAGVPAAQAEGQARALGEALVGPVAMHAGLEALESRLEVRYAKIDARFDTAESRLTTRIEHLKLDLYGKIDTLRWMLGVAVALNAAVFVQTFLRR